MISSTKIFDSETFSDWIVYNDETHREYLVTVDHEDDICYCTCPDFQYRKQTEKFGGAKLDDNSHHCKHIRQVIACG